MKRISALLGLLVLLAACAPETDLPSPNGKGAVRAINAIKGSPEVAFRIEERLLEALTYKAGGPATRFDDFEYDFNFDTVFAGEILPTRVATVTQKVDVDQEYMFILTGAIDMPDVEVVVGDIRQWSGTETVFEIRFAHLAESLGDLDFYLDDAAVPPAAGGQRTTLSYGEVADPIDITAGDYVLTVTSAGSPGDIIYQSSPSTYIATTTLVAPLFDGDEMDTAPYLARLLSSAGGSSTLADHRYPSTVRFMQTSFDLPDSDVYDDEVLSSLLLPGLEFGGISDDIVPDADTTGFFFTPAGNTGSVLFEYELLTGLGNGQHFNLVVYGDDSDRRGSFYVPDRRSVSSAARLQVFNSASNHSDGIDVYVLDGSEPLPDANRRFAMAYPAQSSILALVAGDYEIYVTPIGDKTTILAGPEPVTLELGDTVEILLLDNTDPSILDISIVPAL